MATAIKKPAISGPGLNKQGVLVLQSFFIFIFVWLEMWIRSGAGILSGLIICLVTYGGIAYGRKGTRYIPSKRCAIPTYQRALWMVYVL